MLLNFLQEVVILIVGKQAEDIADLLNSKKHVNEFIIAKKLDITINQTRNILYKLDDYGVVSSIRKKDKKKGWYTYFWKVEPVKALVFLKGHLNKKKDQIENQIKSRETKQFYFCETCSVEFSEENALLNDFTCNECGGIFSSKDNTKLLKEFKKNLNKINGEIVAIDEVLDKENEKVEKIKQKELRRLEAEKVAKRKESAKKRAATRKKTLAEKAKNEKVKKKDKKKPVKKKKAAKKKSKKKTVKKKPKKVKGKISKKKVVKKK